MIAHLFFEEPAEGIFVVVAAATVAVVATGIQTVVRQRSNRDLPALATCYFCGLAQFPKRGTSASLDCSVQIQQHYSLLFLRNEGYRHEKVAGTKALSYSGRRPTQKLDLRPWSMVFLNLSSKGV